MQQHPDWTFAFWRLTDPIAHGLVADGDVRALLASPKLSVVVKSDILRLYALLTYGGVYVDTDVTCLAHFDPLRKHRCFIGRESAQWVCPSVVGAECGHPYILAVLNAALSAVRSHDADDCNKRPNEITGPHLWTKVLKGRDDVTVLAPDLFYADAPHEGAYAQHHWAGRSKHGWTRRVELGRAPVEVAGPAKVTPSAEPVRHVVATPVRERQPGDEAFFALYASGGSGSGRGSSPEYTAGFRDFLQGFMRAHGVKSVLDYGCGDWQWARLMDWSGIDYLGVDIVPSLIESLRSRHGRERVRFDLAHDGALPEVDLVICKDVLQHLPNGEALGLMGRMEHAAKHVLWVQDRAKGPNVECVRGAYRPIDLTQPPFGRQGHVVFEFRRPDDKVAFHWSRAGGARSDEAKGASKLKGDVHPLVVCAPGQATSALPTNPSVVVRNGKIVCSVRFFNPATKTSGATLGEISVENVAQGAAIEVQAPHWMEDLVQATHEPRAYTHGYEDLRLFVHRGRLAACATVCDRVAGDPRPKFAVLELSDEGDVVDAVVQPSDREEKNWMPFVAFDDLRFVYMTDPTIVLTYNDETRLVEPSALHVPKLGGTLRGSSQLERRRDGWLAVVHQVHGAGAKWIYLHRFVFFDAELRIKKMSAPFYFTKQGIEFCAGLARVDPQRWILSFGIDDRQAAVALVDDDVVESMLVPVDEAKESGAIAKPVVEATRVLVCHGSHERCGVREYGDQLDRSLARHASVSAYTFQTVNELVAAAKEDPAARVLVHFEPGLVPPTFRATLAELRKNGSKIVFCCHLYTKEALAPYVGLADALVVHRAYADTVGRTVEIPLACPNYTPSAEREALRAELGMSNAVVVTTLGFLAKWKRFPDALDAMLAEASTGPKEPAILWQVQTPWPYSSKGAAEEEAAIRKVLAKYPDALVRFSTEFLEEQALLDRVYASDLGFLFHGSNTGSVSAATKQFVSARTPLVITASTHGADLRGGVHRVPSFDPRAFAREVVSVARNASKRAELGAMMEEEYRRICMDTVADAYVALFRELS